MGPAMVPKPQGVFPVTKNHWSGDSQEQKEEGGNKFRPHEGCLWYRRSIIEGRPQKKKKKKNQDGACFLPRKIKKPIE